MEEKLRVPTHVSIIMDGNGRWAQSHGKERVYGHYAGVDSVRACVEAAKEEGVKYLSLFAFSEENWQRPESEVSSLMELMFASMEKEHEEMIGKGVRFIVLGNRSRLSEKLNASIDKVMEASKDNDVVTMIIFLSYGGRWDILQAALKLAKEMADHPERRIELENIDISGFSRYLITAGIPDPDLVIRTSGEKRISNYMLWQTAYSELLSVDTLWPDFGKPEFHQAIVEYSKRDRRYGKLK
jgi:undecaprenyl diphosphate synthase